MKINAKKLPKIIIVGGGAGGLILATRLGRKNRRHPQCQVTLVDNNLTHIWKPLLHEIAAGSLNSYEDELSYLSQAARNNYQFQLGKLKAIHHEEKYIELDEELDTEGRVLIPARKLYFDYLVVAIGSKGNDFGVPGVNEHCYMLDSRSQAERLHTQLIGICLAAHAQFSLQTPEIKKPDKFHLSIIGGGPTGVELAAELHSSLNQLARYGLREITPQDVVIHLVEASGNILAGQDQRVVDEAREALEKMGINILVNTRVTRVTPDAVATADNQTIPSMLTIWATGIKASPLLQQSDGLATNKINQLIVNEKLQTNNDAVYAIGDCAEFSVNGKRLAPRAHVAQEQAVYLARALMLRIAGQRTENFVFNDKGSFISLSEYNAAGTIMGKVFGAINLTGLAARWTYISLYRKHQYELLGLYKTIIIIVKDFLTRRLGPKIKLH